jgi:hypothetical protein
VRVLLRLALTTRPKLLDSPPMIDLLLLTTRLKRLDSSPPIDLLSLSKLHGAALRRVRLRGYTWAPPFALCCNLAACPGSPRNRFVRFGHFEARFRHI